MKRLTEQHNAAKAHGDENEPSLVMPQLAGRAEAKAYVPGLNTRCP